MCCITLTALEAAMATTQLTQAANFEVRSPWLPQHAEQEPVRMNWVVVIGENGKRQLRMKWDAARDD